MAVGGSGCIGAHIYCRYLESSGGGVAQQVLCVGGCMFSLDLAIEPGHFSVTIPSAFTISTYSVLCCARLVLNILITHICQPSFKALCLHRTC